MANEVHNTSCKRDDTMYVGLAAIRGVIQHRLSRIHNVYLLA